MIPFFQSLIEQYGQWGLFLLTVGEHVILPIFVDPFITLALGNGMSAGEVAFLVIAASFIGSLIGYYLGKWLGHPVMVWLFGRQKVDKGEELFKKWGIWALVVAGVTPIPFKLAAWMAGAFEMPLSRFLLGTAIGRIPRYLAVIYGSAWFFSSGFYHTPEMSALILGAVQGVAEFLPISSSGHLVVVEHFLELPISHDQMAMFDIFLHGGSLLAIVLYFWKDWRKVLKELGGMIRAKRVDHQSLSFKLALGTIPAIVAALTLKDFFEGPFRNLTSVAIFFLLTGLFFFYVAWKGKGNHLEQPGIKKSVLIGCAQAAALIPGVSRAGATMGAGVLLGLTRQAAARFSFMLGGIAILAANVYGLLSVIKDHSPLPSLSFTLVGFFTSFIVSLASVYFLMHFLQKYTLRAFGAYLILAGGLILSFF